MRKKPNMYLSDSLYMIFSLSVDTALAKSALSPHGGGKAVKLLNTLQEEQDRREKKPLLRRDTEEVGTAAPCNHYLILSSSLHRDLLDPSSLTALLGHLKESWVGYF